MPYLWTPAYDTPISNARTTTEAPLFRLELWPHRSLKGRGFSWTIWIMFAGGMIPVVPFIGTIAFWILLIFMMTALAALWTALRKSDRDQLREEMLIWPDRVELCHWTAKGQRLTWDANPYWVRLTLHPKNGQIENYLTLSGAGAEQNRNVELGAFLSPDERQQLRDDLAFVLGEIKRPRAETST
ncbi:DUF2244 domain-containing protein [Celeribacter litoreus]|uniref:DUF2244 domain-containing protein n=1 Tax=Celeribacter litoreus TaxID=2876714 RepID=UPI001CCA96C5|nr:DUF2244 domain-containing protein [Celeribacter litoreus]MCA0043123.1 DUF2244 domain-containing protein [Celeribacter litoreus]